ncbi:hypothetical protein U9M48_012779 [Paspalum notatum var. saurae]|uniref:Uncharacterized protein n=1 Tax=Paspalum notatum var. saurae TaxID=547442 RepID=A0AAQ3WIY6_PASNO
MLRVTRAVRVAVQENPPVQEPAPVSASTKMNVMGRHRLVEARPNLRGVRSTTEERAATRNGRNHEIFKTELIFSLKPNKPSGSQAYLPLLLARCTPTPDHSISRFEYRDCLI